MYRPGGTILVVDPDPPRGTPGVREVDTFTCAHCQRLVEVPVRASPADCGGWCGRCAKPVCGPCADTGVCDPWERQLERLEARDRFLRSIGLG